MIEIWALLMDCNPRLIGFKGDSLTEMNEEGSRIVFSSMLV